MSFNRKRAYFYLLLNTILWGFSAPIIKYSLNFTSPNLFLMYRFIIASILFAPFYLIHQKNSHNRKTSLWLMILIAMLGTPLTLLPIFYGLNLTSAIAGSILSSTSPIFVIAGGLLFLKERMSRNEKLGFIITLIGTAVLTLEPLFYNRTLDGSMPGNLLILASNFIWALFLILAKKFKVDTINLTFISFLISIPFFFLLSVGAGSLSLDIKAFPGVAYMAIFGSIVAFWAYTEGQKHIEASEAAIFTYLQPLFGLPLALLWLREPMTPVAVVSLVIISLGVFRCQKR